jgi:hypothetical protein
VELPGDGPPEPGGEESLPGQLETVVAHIQDLQVGPAVPRRAVQCSAPLCAVP